MRCVLTYLTSLTQFPQNPILSATITTASTAMATAAESELKTYWCHECDMSVSLTSSPSPSPLLCPHCHTHFLELMDSPFPQNDAVPFPSLFFDSPQNDVEDLLHFAPLLAPSSKTTPSKPPSVPVISATASLLSQLDSNGVVFCAVCKDEIGINVDAKQLPCKHLYHSECITPWLELHSSCPLCRFQLVVDEEDEEEEDNEIRRQLRAAMVMLSELTEEEQGEDFYGLRTTLNHIASRYGLIDGDGDGDEDEGLRIPDGRS